jgi:peptidoglycan DL-endopeptidase CwlO
MNILSRLTIVCVCVISIGAFSTVKQNSVKADLAVNTTQQSVELKTASIKSKVVIVIPNRTPASKIQNGTMTSSSNSKNNNLNLGRGGSARTDVVSFALQFVGRPYVWGASGPYAFDCSGFTAYVYSKFGVYLPHYTVSQYNSGQPVSRGNLVPGDLVFFNTYQPIGHVGIYIGGGQYVHAASSRTGVIVSELGSYAGARRVK